MSDDDRTFERRARAWLELGPVDPPAEAVQAALLTIESIDQERDLRIPWRLPAMNSRLRLAAAAVVGVLAVGLIYLNLPRAGEVGTPTQTPAASPTARPSPSAAAAIDYSTTPGWIVFEHFGRAPDGSSTEFNGDLRQIWLVHADGTGFHELAPGKPANKIAPDISPDGKTIVFASYEPFAGIYQVPIEGTDATRLDIPCLAEAGFECDLGDPAYSADGKKIAFVKVEFSSTTFSSEIAVYDLASGQTHAIESTRTPNSVNQPTWSPDGLQLAYHLDTQPAPGEPLSQVRIEVVNVDGTGLHELPAPAGDEMAGDPDWSPDGSVILFSTAPNRETEGILGDFGIYTIHPDGTGLSEVCVPCLSGGFAPSYTPDGTHILFFGYQTWAMMDLDGSNMATINRELLFNGENLGFGYFALLQPTP